MKTLATSLCALLLLMLGSTSVLAQTITVDGDLSEWTEDMRLDVPPNQPIITWHDGADGRDNSPADPEDLDYLVDVNFAALYAADDEDYLYLRIDMNERADVRNLLDESVYSNGRIEVYISTDPDLFEDFRDYTGMTWGWYYSGYDFIARVYPFDTEFEDETGFQNQITEHAQFDGEGNPITGYSYAPYARRSDIGVHIVWNDEFNAAELAIPKSIILQPVNLPDYEVNDHVAIMLMSGAANERTGNEWWSQRIGANLDVLGFIYTYGTEWSGQDINVSNEGALELPQSITLEQNYPNPFNPTTAIAYTLSSSQHARIEVFDLLGRSVAVLQDGVMPAGEHSVTFDAAGLSSGLYLYRLSTPSQSVVRVMSLLK
jgi:hypothetical protein